VIGLYELLGNPTTYLIQPPGPSVSKLNLTLDSSYQVRQLQLKFSSVYSCGYVVEQLNMLQLVISFESGVKHHKPNPVISFVYSLFFSFFIF
jgi:hypothetical protein